MSNRRSPSSSSTLGRYRLPERARPDHGGLLAATTDHDPHVEATLGGSGGHHQRTHLPSDEVVDDLRGRARRALGRPRRPHRPTVLDHADRAGHRRPGAEQHGQVDPSHPGAPQPFEQALRRRRPVQHQHRSPTGPPERRACRHLEPARRRIAQRHPREQGDHEHDGRHRRGDHPDTVGAGEHADRARQPDPGDVPGSQLTQRRGRGPARHLGDPRDEQTRRQVQQVGDGATRHAGRDASHETPGHDEPSRRTGQQVRRDGRHGHATERRHEERRDRELGTGGDRERLDQQRRPAEAAPQHRRDHEDADRCGDGQPEPDRPHQQGVDQHQTAHGQREVPQRGSRPPGHERGGGEGRHRGGAQDRRLASGDEREEGEHAEGDGPPRRERQASEHRPGHGQHEGDVLARHRQQVSEAGPAEVVGERGRLVTVVAEHEAGEERPPLGRQRAGAVGQHPPDAVGGPPGRAARTFELHRPRLQPADEMADLHPPRARRAAGDPAHDPHPFAGQSGAEGAPTGAARPELVALALDADVGDRRAEAVLRVAHERGHARVGRRPGRREPVDGPAPHRSRHQGDPDEEHPGSTGRERDDHEPDTQPEGRRPGERRADPGDRGEQEGLAVREPPLRHRDRRQPRTAVLAGAHTAPIPGAAPPDPIRVRSLALTPSPDRGGRPAWRRRCPAPRAARRPR